MSEQENPDNGELKKQLDRIKSTTDRIESAIVGSPEFGTTGIIPRLAKVEKAQRDMSRKLAWASGFIACLLMAWEAFRGKIFH